MPIFDFECANGHVSEHFISAATVSVDCPECGGPAGKVHLRAPRIDWYGMGAQANVGPEFIDRWAKMHDRETRKQEKCLKEHGDYGPGYLPPPV